MDFAKCTIDNINYKAYEFEKLSPSDLAYKRRFLVCKECGGPAFFRKASKKGQAACFGARPHKDDCKLATQDSENTKGSLTNEEKEYLNSGNKIIIDLNFGAQQIINIENSDDEEIEGHVKGNLYSSKNGQGKAKSHRRLSTLLRTLINDKEFFKNSKQKIALNNYTYNANKLFAHFDDLTENYVNDIVENNPYTRRAIWGMISDARYANKENKTIWLNTGGNDTISVLIDESFHDLFLNRFKITDLEELSGKYLLTIGQLNKSKNGKVFSKVGDIAYISIV